MKTILSILALILFFSPARANCEAQPSAAKWCSTTTIPWGFGQGLTGTLTGPALTIKLAIQNAIGAINTDLASLGSSISLSGPGASGNGITFSYGKGIAKGSGGCGTALDYGRTRTKFSVQPTDKMATLTSAEVDFNNQFTGWTGTLALNVAYHEIAHALGVDHVYTIAPGSCPPSGSPAPLMYDTHACADNPGLDGLFDKAIQCMYGSDYEGAPLMGVSFSYRSGRKTKTTRSSCSGSSSCSGFGGLGESIAALRYDLLISDNGGPFVLFASINEGDWVDNAYEFDFPASHVNARVQLQVWDGATLIAAPVSDAISIPMGACSATACPATDACHDALCDPGSGACSNEPKPDGSTCNDGSSCSTHDVCTAGVCAGTSGTAPAEVDNGVRVTKTSGGMITWNLAVNATSSAVLRGLVSALPVGPGGGDEVCLASNLPPSTLSLGDATTPAAGTAFWYLVRGDAACGAGSLGFRAQNGVPIAPRITTTCP